MSILGHPVLRREDPRFLTVGGTYVDDLDLPGCVTATYVRSPVAHARLLGVDTSAAAGAPGVLAVLTAADLADLPDFPHVMPVLPDAMRRPFLARGIVRFVGEPVAVVVAETTAQGADAAELVEVDYDPLPALVDPEAVAGERAAAVPRGGHERRAARRHRGCRRLLRTARSSSASGWSTSASPAAPSRAGPAPPTGPTTAASSTTRRARAPTRPAGSWPASTGWSESQVRVVVPDVGGGFGSKARPYPEEVLLGELARRVGRPVRWVETRTENMLALAHGRGQVHHVTIGGTRDGRITAYQLDVVQDAGAYPLIAAILINMTMRMTTGVYDLANVGFSGVSVATTTTPMTAFRGAGRPEAAAAIERAVDLFAAEIGLDPVEVRRRNLVAPFADTYTTAVGTRYDVGDYAGALDRALAGRRLPGAAGRAGPPAGGRRRAAAGHRPVGLRRDHRRCRRLRVRLGRAAGRRRRPRRDRLDALRPGPRHRLVDGRRRPDRHPDGAHRGRARRHRRGPRRWAHRRLRAAPRWRGRRWPTPPPSWSRPPGQQAADLLEANPDDVVLDRAAGRFHVAGTPARSVGWAEVAAGGRATR